MERWQAETIYNDLCAHYLGIRADSVRRGYLDKLCRLPAEPCAEACAELVTISPRFPSLAAIFGATNAKRAQPRSMPETREEFAHTPLSPGVKRLLARVTSADRRGVNPVLSAEEVRRVHERWSPAVRARRISGCACCELYRTQALREATDLMEPSAREPGCEG